MCCHHQRLFRSEGARRCRGQPISAARTTAPPRASAHERRECTAEIYHGAGAARCARRFSSSRTAARLSACTEVPRRRRATRCRRRPECNPGAHSPCFPHRSCSDIVPQELLLDIRRAESLGDPSAWSAARASSRPGSACSVLSAATAGATTSSHRVRNITVLRRAGCSSCKPRQEQRHGFRPSA